MNSVKPTADIIVQPQNRRERSIYVVKNLKKAVDTKLKYLFQGLCINAADALFEEQFGTAYSDDLARHFNITRALRVRSEVQFQEFRMLQAQVWVNLLNKKNQVGLVEPDQEFAEVLHRYSERNRNHYKILLEELRQRFSALTESDLNFHPLLPLNFYLCFWHSSECLELTSEERQLVMVLFNRFVMDRFGQVLALANQSLVEQGIEPVARP